ncbi:unnamed protein product [Arabidopsis halleri]
MCESIQDNLMVSLLMPCISCALAHSLIDTDTFPTFASSLCCMTFPENFHLLLVAKSRKL